MRPLKRSWGYPNENIDERWGKTRIVTVNIPEMDLEYIERFICDTKLVPSRSEYVRVAIRNQIVKDLEMVKDELAIVEEEKTLELNNLIKVPGYNGNKPIKLIRRLE